MESKQKELYDKFSKIVDDGINEGSLSRFFSGLNDDEYEALVTMFEENDFFGISDQDRERVIKVLYGLEGL